MSKVINLYVVLMLTMLNASNIESEVGVNIGLNSTKNDGGSKFENPSLGISYQNNKYLIKPRFDLEYVKVKDDYASSFLKGSVNGVYEYVNSTYVVPYALAGIGYEYVSGGTENVLESLPFAQGGVGVRVDLKGGYKVRVEGKMLQVIGSKNSEGNEAMITAGISFPFGYNKTIQRKRVLQKPRQIIKPRPLSFVAPKIVYVDKNKCSIKISAPDFDRDGIPNNIDQCPATPCNFTVDAYGCPIKTRLEIHFESNSAEIKRTSFPRVYQFAQFLLKNKGSRVKIVGHTDSKGSASYNLGLSQRRARAIVNSLVQQGVSPSRVEAFGEGERMPVTTNTTAEGRAMNRRIEAELSYPKGRR